MAALTGTSGTLMRIAPGPTERVIYQIYQTGSQTDSADTLDVSDASVMGSAYTLDNLYNAFAFNQTTGSLVNCLIAAGTGITLTPQFTTAANATYLIHMFGTKKREV